jgi:predicted transcriptional regulator
MLSNIFNHNLVAVERGANLLDVAKLMAREDVGCVLVLDNRKPCGMVTDRDIVIHCLALGHNSQTCSVEEVMSPDLQIVKETDGIFDCIRAMNASKVRRLPVVDSEGNALGVVSFGDILSVLGKEFSELVETTTPSRLTGRKAA